jgi:N-methylhydantoinase A
MLGPGHPSIAGHFEDLERQGLRDMKAEGLESVASRFVDLRYQGQGYELTVEWSDDVIATFHRLHEQRYGYSDAERPTEIVNLRIRMVAATEQPALQRREPRKGDASAGVIKKKPIYFDGRELTATVYDRARLQSGDRFAGPAVVVEYSATTFLPPECRAYVDEYGNLLIDAQRNGSY